MRGLPAHYGSVLRATSYHIHRDRERRLQQAEHDMRIRALRQKHENHLSQQAQNIGNSVIFRRLSKKASQLTPLELNPTTSPTLPVAEPSDKTSSFGGAIPDPSPEEEEDVPVTAYHTPSIEEQLGDGSAAHPYVFNDENIPPCHLDQTGAYIQDAVRPAPLHPPYIIQKVDKKVDQRGFVRHPPPPLSKIIDIFGGSFDSDLHELDIKLLTHANVDLACAAEVWRNIQLREKHRLIAIKLKEEDEENQKLYEKNQKVSHKGSKTLIPSGSRILDFGRSVTSSRICRSECNSIIAARLRVQAIREGVARLEKKLRRNMKSYIEGWHVISSASVPTRVLSKFRDLPWPITDGWATAPEELTKDEIRRFLFAKCNIPKFFTRKEVFKAALSFWEPDTFAKNIHAWYPGSETLPSNVLEGAKLVYGHIQELEEEMEPGQAADRKRRLEEEALLNSPPIAKRRRFVMNVWEKFTGVLRVPASFNFNSMTAAA
jgi:hypothetical protein